MANPVIMSNIAGEATNVAIAVGINRPALATQNSVDAARFPR
jgi:hypothetical protein